MPGFDGTGPMGLGPMTGGGRGFCNPWRRGTALRMYGLPRWSRYGYPYYRPRPFSPGAAPLAPRMGREQELEFLKSAAQALRKQLKEMEAKMEQFSTEKE